MNFLILSVLLPRFVGHARDEFPDHPMTVTETKIVAGYYTEGGTYLGGTPKLGDVSKEIYECLDDDYFFTTTNDTSVTNASTSDSDTGHATACMHWRADESAGGTSSSGRVSENLSRTKRTARPGRVFRPKRCRTAVKTGATAT